MKKIFTAIIVSTFLYSLPTTTILNVEGMTCANGCAPKINKAALDIQGVESCNVNFDLSKATLVFDNEKVTELEILNKLKLNTTFEYAIDKTNKVVQAATCANKSCCNKTKKVEKKSFFQRIFGL